jgi:hypothetical protein
MKKALLAALVAVACTQAAAADYYIVLPVPAKTANASAIQVSLGASALPTVLVGDAYSYDLAPLLQVTGDSKFSGYGVKWAVASGSLPPGLVLNAATGIISGTPTSGGTWPFAVGATYMTKTGQQAYQVVSLDVKVALSSATLPASVAGAPYSYDMKGLVSVSGDPAYKGSGVTWDVAAEALPAGLSLDQATGIIGGTPAAFSDLGATFSVKATYRSKSAQQSYTLYPKDPYFANVTLLAHLDAEPFVNAKTGAALTSYGGPMVSTTTKQFGTGAAGTSGAGKAVGAPAFRPAADYTIEGWLMPIAGTSGATIIDIGGIDQVNWQSQAVYYGWPAAGQLNWMASSANNGTDISNGTKCAQPCSDYISFGAPTPNAWNHFAVVYSSAAGQYYLYLNGTRTATVTSTKRPYQSSYMTIIGGFPKYSQTGIGNGFAGYLDEFRLTDGVARYSGATYPVPAFAFPSR